MAISVLEANLLDNARQAQVLVDKGYDLYVFPEACRSGENLDDLHKYAADNGLRAIQVPYGDTDRKDKHDLLVLARERFIVGDPETIYMAANEKQQALGIGRAAVKICMRDPGSGKKIDIFTAHFDDRLQESNRNQARSLEAYMTDGNPTGVIGDLNSANREGVKAKAITAMFRWIGAIARRLPSLEPGTPKPPASRITERLGWHIKYQLINTLGRLGEMSTGQTLAYFASIGFKDDDSRHRPTMTNRFPLVKLDHMLTRDAFAVTVPLKHKDGMSDHRMLSGYIQAA